MKRWLICVLMLMAVLSLAEPARAEEYSGTCGDNLNWNFNESTGQLTISGEGAMEDYPFSAVDEYMAPWYAHRDSITEIVMNPGITYIGNNAFLSNRDLVSVTIPDTVSSIGQCAFYECASLKEIDLPNSITEFDYRVFAYCTSLTDVRLPAELKAISIRMFEECTSLAKIDLPETVVSIGYGAFMDCDSVMNIRIPAAVETIENDAFESCDKLLNVVFMGSAPVIESGAFASSNPTIYYSAEDTTWTQTVVDKLKGNLKWVAVEDPAAVELPGPGDVLEGSCGPDAKWRLENGTLTITGTGAVDSSPWFGYRSEITTVTVGHGITNFGSVAFSNVEKITLPDTLTVIKNGAFRGCERLEQVIIPAGVTQIGANAFWDCVSLKRIELPAGIKGIEGYTFCNCDALVEIILPEALEYIGERAFQSCDSLPKIVFPKSLKTIGDYAFVGCKNLNTVIFQGDAPTIYQFAFNELSFYAYYPVGNKTWTESVFHGFLGNKVWIAGTGETSGTCGTGLTWNIQGDTLIIAGNGPMKDYHLDALGAWTGYKAQIKKLVVEEGVTYIGKFAFYIMSGITTVELPEGLLEIGTEAFAGCMGLKEITIPNSVKKLGDRCFSQVIYLEKLTLGEDLETIGEAAFYETTWLKEVVLPANVKSVGRYAFSMCSRLESAIFLGAAPSIAQDSFELDKVTIYYPAREESWSATAAKYFLGVKAFVADCIPDHTMGDWERTKEPTVDLYGEEQRKCMYCEEFEVRDVPKLEPSPTEPSTPGITEPTRPTQPDVTSPTTDTTGHSGREPGRNGFAVAVIVVSVMAAGGGAALALVSIRKRK